MTQWLSLLATMWFSSVSAQFGAIVNGITKEVVAVKDPIDKTAVYVGFSQCKHVKRLFGVDYEQYKEEPDMSHLTLDFVTQEIKTEYNLTALTTIPLSKWFRPKNGLLIYIHGFTDDPSKDSFKNISNAFLLKGNKNILALDASSLIHWLYLRSSTMVRFIGEELGKAMANMVKAGLNPASIHLIGHSLGSHIAGFAGKTLYSLTGLRVGRISGLDPAGPCFADVSPALRLNKTDADYVDVIHTDAGVYGINEVVGDVDYYPNSGSEQPECILQTCSHSFAWLLYAESVTNETGFPAVACDSWKDFKKDLCNNNTISFMGYSSKPGTVGQYYLQTANKPPYALGTDGIKHVNKDGIVRSIRDQIGLWKR